MGSLLGSSQLPTAASGGVVWRAGLASFVSAGLCIRIRVLEDRGPQVALSHAALASEAGTTPFLLPVLGV